MSLKRIILALMKKIHNEMQKTRKFFYDISQKIIMLYLKTKLV